MMSKTQEINVLGNCQARSHRKKYQVALESDKLNPSFVVYDCNDHNKATTATKVSMLDARYNSSGKMNTEQRRGLVKWLNSACDVTGFRHMTNWQRAIVTFNQNAIKMTHDWEKFTSGVKRYNKNKWKFNKFKFALPIDMPMPDYSQL